MSDRGSFCTEYIYCKNCYQAALHVFEYDEYSCVDWFCYGPHPAIISGKIRGPGGGEETWKMADFVAGSLSEKICCPMRFVVMSDSSGDFFVYVDPNDDKQCKKIHLNPEDAKASGGFTWETE